MQKNGLKKLEKCKKEAKKSWKNAKTSAKAFGNDAIKIVNGNVKVNKNKIYLPIYMIYLIQKRKNYLDTLIDIDISNL